jgi:hypothetical protein
VPFQNFQQIFYFHLFSLPLPIPLVQTLIHLSLDHHPSSYMKGKMYRKAVDKENRIEFQDFKSSLQLDQVLGNYIEYFHKLR